MVVSDLKKAMVEAVGDKMTFEAVPNAHRQKGQEKSHMCVMDRILD